MGLLQRYQIGKKESQKNRQKINGFQIFSRYLYITYVQYFCLYPRFSTDYWQANHRQQPYSRPQCQLTFAQKLLCRSLSGKYARGSKQMDFQEKVKCEQARQWICYILFTTFFFVCHFFKCRNESHAQFDLQHKPIFFPPKKIFAFKTNNLTFYLQRRQHQQLCVCCCSVKSKKLIFFLTPLSILNQSN